MVWELLGIVAVLFVLVALASWRFTVSRPPAPALAPPVPQEESGLGSTLFLTGILVLMGLGALALAESQGQVLSGYEGRGAGWRNGARTGQYLLDIDTAQQGRLTLDVDEGTASQCGGRPSVARKALSPFVTCGNDSFWEGAPWLAALAGILLVLGAGVVLGRGVGETKAAPLPGSAGAAS